MADSVALQPSWIPLIESALTHQVMKTVDYVLPNAKCSIVYGPEVRTLSPKYDRKSADICSLLFLMMASF